MARARGVKPGFFRNADLVDLPFETRLLFIGLWTIADRAGRLEDRPKQIKMEIFPADNLDCDAMLSALDKSGMIDRYTWEGKSYIQITNFSKHQNPHKDEKASAIPDKSGICTVQAPCKPGATSEAILLTPDSLTPDSLLLTPDSKTKPDFFEIAWQEYPSRPGASRAASLKAWRARIKSGVDPESILAGVARYSAYCKAENIDQRFIKQPATFFGPDEHYLSAWAIPPPASSKPAKFDPVAHVNQNRKRANEPIDITPQPVA